MDTEAILDGKEPEKTPEKPEEKKAPASPSDELRKLNKGTLQLLFPIRAASTDITALDYDFCGLTSLEMMEAMDMDATVNLFGITNRQALYLFAATAGKCNEKVDMNDVYTRLSSADAVKAVQLAKLFYAASSRRVSTNT